MAAQMAVSSMFQRCRVVVLFNAWFPNDAVYIYHGRQRASRQVLNSPVPSFFSLPP